MEESCVIWKPEEYGSSRKVQGPGGCLEVTGRRLNNVTGSGGSAGFREQKVLVSPRLGLWSRCTATVVSPERTVVPTLRRSFNSA